MNKGVRKVVVVQIYNISIALQIAGALILLLWSLGNTRDKVIKGYFPGSNIAERNDENKVCLDKEKLRRKAEDIYMNRYAFVCLIIGYGASLFGELIDYNRWKAFVIIEVESICIILIGIIVSKLLARITFKEDEIIDFSKLEGVDTCMTDRETESTKDIFSD